MADGDAFELLMKAALCRVRCRLGRDVLSLALLFDGCHWPRPNRRVEDGELCMSTVALHAQDLAAAATEP
ncbi:MAG: hypothetical protein LC732_10625 [Acidobacteria bacterium]|nr:hypothetical protein [Acidobacteriota bacterium]